MAIQYRWEGSNEVSAQEALTFIADALGGKIIDGGGTLMGYQPYVEWNNLVVLPRQRALDEERSHMSEVFGYIPRISVLFRWQRDSDLNAVAMIRTVLAFLARYPGDGLLLFNGEGLVLQRLNGRLVLNGAWWKEYEWTDIPELCEIAARHEVQLLPTLL